MEKHDYNEYESLHYVYESLAQPPSPKTPCVNQIRLINTLNEEYLITMIRKML